MDFALTFDEPAMGITGHGFARAGTMLDHEGMDDLQ